MQQFLKQNNMMDVCIQVAYVEDLKDTKPGFLKIYGFWWNMAYVRSFNIGEWAEVVVSKEDMNNEWKVVTLSERADKMVYLRTADWK